MAFSGYRCPAIHIHVVDGIVVAIVEIAGSHLINRWKHRATPAAHYLPHVHGRRLSVHYSRHYHPLSSGYCQVGATVKALKSFVTYSSFNYLMCLTILGAKVATRYFILFSDVLRDDERLFSREIKGFWSLNKERLPRKLPLRSSLTYDGIARNVPSVY